MLSTIEYGYDIGCIVNRIKNEAENVEQMAELINAEIYAYFHFSDVIKPYFICMWDKSKIINDVVAVGEFWENEEDMEDESPGYIVVTSDMKNGIYRAYYSKLWKQSI